MSETEPQSNSTTTTLRDIIPEVFRTHAAFHRSALVEGVCSRTLKESVVLVLAAHTGCVPCIDLHAKTVARSAVDETMLAELLGLAVLMGGGSGFAGAERAWTQFVQERSAHSTPSRPAKE